MFLSHRNLAAFSRLALWMGFLLAATFALGQSGCVQRRMTVRTNPPGALLYVDDYEIGTTPISTNFTYYGNRKIRLVKDGYETLTVIQPIPAPWYEYLPFDFVTENFLPGEIRDQRTIDFQLKPQMIVPTDQLISRAEGMRRNNYALPTGTTMSQPGGIAPYQQPGVPNAAPSNAPSVMSSANPYQPPGGFPQSGNVPQPNTYQPQNVSPPPANTQPQNINQPPGGFPQSNVNQTPQGIGGQGIYQLPPR